MLCGTVTIVDDDGRGAVKLELPSRQQVDQIAADPEPDWSFDALLSELNSLEKKLNAASPVPGALAKTQPPEFSNGKSAQRGPTGFVMHVSDDEMEGSEEEDEGEESGDTTNLVEVKRFHCDGLYMSESDESDYELALGTESHLMGGLGLVEAALVELSHEHRLGVTEEIRNQISALEIELFSENEKSASAIAQIDKYREARREVERKLDTQYQRKIAEALDKHITAVQRNHEIKSQIEEKKIRSDAAHEEAKRKEKAFQQERLRQERARAEAEAKLKAEEEKRAALEAERKAAKEAAEKEAAEASKQDTVSVSLQEGSQNQIDINSAKLNLQSEESVSNAIKKQSAVDIVKAAQSALKLEQERLKKLKELNEQNKALILSSKMDFGTFERHIARSIRQIRGTKENVRAKATDLIKILRNPSCPLSISLAAFAKKLVSHCESPDNAAFACGHVIVLVTSQVPHAMDLLLAEFHRACIYTVPKHILNLKSMFVSKAGYQKAIGYQDNDGKIESTTEYLKRLASYMKLYGALVQTEVQGVQNIHGPNEGWAWLARFLNTLPANIFTAVALNAFLQTAGFVLFKKYRSQFRKLLNIISNDFLKALRERQDPEMNPIIFEIQSYIEDNKYLQEPEGRSLRESLLSKVMVPESDSRRGYY